MGEKNTVRLTDALAFQGKYQDLQAAVAVFITGTTMHEATGDFHYCRFFQTAVV